MIKIAIPNKAHSLKPRSPFSKKQGIKLAVIAKHWRLLILSMTLSFSFSGRKTSPFMWQMANSISVSLAVISQ